MYSRERAPVRPLVTQPHIDVRPLATRDEYEACVRLQREIWGPDFLDVVPATILMVSQRIGSVVAGAFDQSGELVGFVFGITGLEGGRPVHWSNMLAVRPSARGRGLGTQLKLFQRRQLLDIGVEIVYWSFDPLVARNANLNLNRLGARPIEYVPNMYGDTGSTLHHGLATDRLIVKWPLRDPAADGHLMPSPDLLDTPLVTLTPDPGTVDRQDFPDGAYIRLAIPSSIDEIKRANPSSAQRWQDLLRRAFPRYLREGYRVVGFTAHATSDLAWYILSAGSSPARRGE